MVRMYTVISRSVGRLWMLQGKGQGHVKKKQLLAGYVFPMVYGHGLVQILIQTMQVGCV